MAEAQVTFQPSRKLVAVDPANAPFRGVGEPGSVLDIALANGVEISTNCGGNCVCGSCYVIVENGAENLSGPDDEERETLDTMTDNAPNGRLACQAIVRGSVTVRVPD
jgi:2Fe-2S ferredoxin